MFLGYPRRFTPGPQEHGNVQIISLLGLCYGHDIAVIVARRRSLNMDVTILLINREPQLFVRDRYTFLDAVRILASLVTELTPTNESNGTHREAQVYDFAHIRRYSLCLSGTSAGVRSVHFNLSG